MALTQVDQGLLSSTAQYTGFKNRLINPAMVIDQRNAGAAVSKPSGYTLDRWFCNLQSPVAATLSRSTVAPNGFTQSLFVSVTTGASIGTINYIQQPIEGFNTSDFAFGTASASTVTLSFWVRSSITGTFGGSLRNITSNVSTRAYPFTYVITSANTWEQKTIVIAGDTVGITISDNGQGLSVFFDLGSNANTGTAGSWTSANLIGTLGTQTGLMATNGATFYITGVQLEKGSTATSFDFRSYGTELALCQRYFETQLRGWATAWAAGMNNFSTVFAVPKRASPTLTFYAGTSGTYNRTNAGFVRNETSSTNISVASGLTDASSCTGDYISPAGASNMRVLLDASSEL